jgi:NADH-quinone oxidoreductase subunit G/NADP-reducing hydrogenase subunit HndD
MEEASELVQRLTSGGPLPMFTSCSPGWVKFVEQFYPELLPNISTCKSPQQMMGAVLKSWYAREQGIAPDKIFTVAIMPCTAKKFEAGRPEMRANDRPDVDLVLTTRELGRFLKMRGVQFTALEPDTADSPLGARSSAGKIFGASGGVMEAAIRTAHHLVTGRDLDELRVQAVRGLEAVKRAQVALGERTLNVAVVSGLDNARKILEEIRAGRSDLHFVEVMTCPGGCIAGGGQPIGADLEAIRARMGALYRVDREASVRTAHANTAVQKLYADFLGEPLGERSHALLHTHYGAREIVG